MDVIFEILIQLIEEIILQLAVNALFELGVRRVRPALKREPGNPYFAALGYILLGVATGGISLLMFPRHMIQVQWLKLLSLAAVPAASGVAMSLVGRLRRRQGKELIRLDSFMYGFLFALAMTLIRFFWGK
jgi:hypothetical protein